MIPFSFSFPLIHRQAASGELLAMSLLLEDTLFTSDLAHQVKTLQRAPSTISRLSKLSHTFQLSRQSSQWGMGRQNRTQPPSTPLPPIPPIPAYQLLYRFLIVTSQVEQLRDAWGCSLLGVAMIKSQKEVTHLDELYTSRVMVVARRLVARQEAKSMMKMQMENVGENKSGLIFFFIDDFFSLGNSWWWFRITSYNVD